MNHKTEKFALPKGKEFALTLCLDEYEEGEKEIPTYSTDAHISGEVKFEGDVGVSDVNLALIRRLETNLGNYPETLFWQETLTTGEETSTSFFPFYIDVEKEPYTYAADDLKISWFIVIDFRAQGRSYSTEREVHLIQPEQVEVMNALIVHSDHEVAILDIEKKGNPGLPYVFVFFGFFAFFLYLSFSLAAIPLAMGGGMSLSAAIFLYRKWKGEDLDLAMSSTEMNRSVSPGELFHVELRFRIPRDRQFLSSAISFIRREKFDDGAYRLREEVLLAVEGPGGRVDGGGVVAVKADLNLADDLKHSFSIPHFQLYYVVKFTLFFSHKTFEKEVRVRVVPKLTDF